MRILLSLSFLLITFFTKAQEEIKPKDSIPVKIDSLYREDQFYLGVTYNRLLNEIEGLDQQRFSAGVSAGFQRDMPLNKRRNIAIAAGLGFTYNNYFQNIIITKVDGENNYFITDQDDFSRNKFSQFLVDVPIEFRWRTSTTETYKFWRVYSGLKLSYLISDASVVKSDEGKIKLKNNDDFNQFLYGVYLSVGYNTWNFYGYYGLNSLFKSGVKTLATGEELKMQTLNFGLIFYIL